MDWLKAHKTLVAAVFAALSAAATTLPDPNHYIAMILGFVASFLAGAGILPSDAHAKEEQAGK